MNLRQKFTVGPKIQRTGCFYCFSHVDALVLRLLCEDFHNMIEIKTSIKLSTFMWCAMIGWQDLGSLDPSELLDGQEKWVLLKASPRPATAQRPEGPAAHGPRPTAHDGPAAQSWFSTTSLSSGKSKRMHRSASGLGVQNWRRWFWIRLPFLQTCACGWIYRWTKNCGKSGLGRGVAGPLGRRGPWAAGRWPAFSKTQEKLAG